MGDGDAQDGPMGGPMGMRGRGVIDFIAIDTDGDGSLSRAELRPAPPPGSPSPTPTATASLDRDELIAAMPAPRGEG